MSGCDHERAATAKLFLATLGSTVCDDDAMDANVLQSRNPNRQGDLTGYVEKDVSGISPDLSFCSPELASGLFDGLTYLRSRSRSVFSRPY
jgi:hypothetical protein